MLGGMSLCVSRCRSRNSKTATSSEKVKSNSDLMMVLLVAAMAASFALRALARFVSVTLLRKVDYEYG